MAGNRRRLRIAVLMAGGVLLTASAITAYGLKVNVGGLTTHAIAVTAEPIAFALDHGAQRSFGRLTWLGGVVLSSRSPYFGGYSGLAVAADGRRLLAVSDSGSWLSADLVHASSRSEVSNRGRVTGLARVRIGAILQRDGTPLPGGGARDAEALAPLRPGALDGDYLIGFERRHRLERYRFDGEAMRGPLRRHELGPLGDGLALNAGLEGVTVLRGGAYAGAIVAFAERRLDGEGHHTGVMLRDGTAGALRLKRDPGFDVTGLEGLADGSLLVLERRFIPAQLRIFMRLRRIPATEMRSGRLLAGEVLFQSDDRQRIDNMEGIAVHEDAVGRTIITLISDDNFNPLQRTLLMQFALEDGERR